MAYQNPRQVDNSRVPSHGPIVQPPRLRQNHAMVQAQEMATRPDRPDQLEPVRVQHPLDREQQWPLRDEHAQAVPRPGQRGPPPPRPPRPSQTLLLPGTRPAPNQGPHLQVIPQYRQDSGEWDDDDSLYPTPNLSRPLTGSSRASTSSEYSIPDFPVPQVPRNVVQQNNQPSNRKAPLGPPPSARRGPSSYYQHTSFVPPIVEETDSIRSHSTRTAHDSYASSAAIPIGISEHYLENEEEIQSDNESPFDERYEEPSEDESPSDHGDAHEEFTAVPVRQASIGRRSRPTLTTISSNDSLRPDSQTQPLPQIQQHAAQEADTFGISHMSKNRQVENWPMVDLATNVKPTPEAIAQSEKPTNVSNLDEPAVSGSTDSTSLPDNEKSLKQQHSREVLAAAREQIRAQSPSGRGGTGNQPSNESSEKSSISNNINPGYISQLSNSEKQGNLAKRIGTRRPPRLDVDAVKEAEARGSLTSLPELIMRATRLASNLDRGRTASRLGMDWFGAEGEAHGLEKRKSGNSLSDILASFPPPAIATPTGSRGSRGMGQWPSHLRHSVLPSESDFNEDAPKKRRCCGMPLWVFLLLLVVVLLIIAAAVVIPVVLVYLPEQQQSNSPSGALAACQKTLTCNNGGTSVVGKGDSCGCLCVNGFTGTTCSEKSSTGCTTIDVDGASNVTVGDAIPRLVGAASTDFSIPLNGTLITNLFSSNSLSCTSENALVTLNGKTARSVQVDVEMAFDAPTPTTLDRRQDTIAATSAAVTSNGIVFDNSPSSTESSSTPMATTSISSNSTMLDFARVAVLYVLQDSGNLQSAITAQENLQDFFTSGSTSVGQAIDVHNITLFSGYTADVTTHTITKSDSDITVGG